MKDHKGTNGGAEKRKTARFFLKEGAFAAFGNGLSITSGVVND